MQQLWSNKRFYFSAFGAVGGIISGIIFTILNLDGAVFSSWVLGTGFDGLCIGALLAVSQAVYVGKTVDWVGLRKAATVGGVGGAMGGFLALYAGFPLADAMGAGLDVGRFIGWMFGGAAIGLAMSRVVPNLKAITACFAGAIGGLAGCTLMYLISNLTVGVAVTGAVVGLTIALAETTLRKAWLEVTVRPQGLTLEKQRTLTVTLGENPVLFGCSSDCDVKLAEIVGAKAHFAKVSLTSGRVVLHDLTKETNRPLMVGEGFDISNAHVVVRSRAAGLGQDTSVTA